MKRTLFYFSNTTPAVELAQDSPFTTDTGVNAIDLPDVKYLSSLKLNDWLALIKHYPRLQTLHTKAEGACKLLRYPYVEALHQLSTHYRFPIEQQNMAVLNELEYLINTVLQSRLTDNQKAQVIRLSHQLLNADSDYQRGMTVGAYHHYANTLLQSADSHQSKASQLQYLAYSLLLLSAITVAVITCVQFTISYACLAAADLLLTLCSFYQSHQLSQLATEEQNIGEQQQALTEHAFFSSHSPVSLDLADDAPAANRAVVVA